MDAQAQLPDLAKKIITDMEYLEPFGNENAQPLFFIKDVVLVQKPKLLKDAHVKCSVFADGVVKPVVFFNRPELFNILLERGTEPFTIAAQVSENHWNGNVTIELIGTDIAIQQD